MKHRSTISFAQNMTIVTLEKPTVEFVSDADAQRDEEMIVDNTIRTDDKRKKGRGFNTTAARGKKPQLADTAWNWHSFSLLIPYSTALDQLGLEVVVHIVTIAPIQHLSY